jgi:hypothetical protein
MLILCNFYFDSFSQEPEVQNIITRKDELNKRIEIRYFLTEDVKEIQLTIRKKGTNTYLNRPFLSGDIGENILKGERVIYWIPANDDESIDYSFEFTLVFLDKPAYEKCRQILVGQLDDCRTRFNTEKGNFTKGKLKKSVVWTTLGATSVVIGGLLFSSMRKQTNSFIEYQKLYDKNSDGIIDDNANQPAYETERTRIEQKRKMEPYSKGLMYAGYISLSYGIGKYIFQRFKGIECTITPNCQGGQTITFTKKF